ncbi:hypothetical protein [Rhizobium leguminosarum]|uniref:hypothetical protein n=1 Tax=Rhizobium leguminosarum TaxID=384 RepID=UPI00143F2D66|nr:hypothetical protein [Rhizobium leguminosarum]NKL19111.1 hypothetical protein [Rhizobium leguminosarum bv. viciae]
MSRLGKRSTALRCPRQLLDELSLFRIRQIIELAQQCPTLVARPQNLDHVLLFDTPLMPNPILKTMPLTLGLV